MTTLLEQEAARSSIQEVDGVWNDQLYQDYRLAHLKVASKTAFTQLLTRYAIELHGQRGTTWTGGVLEEITLSSGPSVGSMLVCEPYTDYEGVAGVELKLCVPQDASAYLQYIGSRSLGIRVGHDGQVSRKVSDGWQPMQKTYESADMAMVKAKWGVPDQIVLEHLFGELGLTYTRLDVGTPLSDLREIRAKALKETITRLIPTALSVEEISGTRQVYAVNTDEHDTQYVNARGERLLKWNNRFVTSEEFTALQAKQAVKERARVQKLFADAAEESSRGMEMHIDIPDTPSLGTVQKVVVGELFKQGKSTLGLSAEASLKKKTIKQGKKIVGYELYLDTTMRDGSIEENLVGTLFTDGTVHDAHGMPTNLSERSVLVRRETMKRVRSSFIDHWVDIFAAEGGSRDELASLFKQFVHIDYDGTVAIHRIGMQADVWETVTSEKQLWKSLRRMVKVQGPVYTPEREAWEQAKKMLTANPYMTSAAVGFGLSAIHALAGGDPNTALGASAITTVLGLATTLAAGAVEYFGFNHPQLMKAAQAVKRGGAMAFMMGEGALFPAVFQTNVVDHHTVKQTASTIEHAQHGFSVQVHQSTPELTGSTMTPYISQPGTLYVHPTPVIDASTLHVQGDWVEPMKQAVEQLGGTQGWKNGDVTQAHVLTDWHLHLQGKISTETLDAITKQIAQTHTYDEYMHIREHILQEVSAALAQ